MVRRLDNDERKEGSCLLVTSKILVSIRYWMRKVTERGKSGVEQASGRQLTTSSFDSEEADGVIAMGNLHSHVFVYCSDF
jgi:hypothetical protein